jgi:hypothetical protein
MWHYLNLLPEPSVFTGYIEKLRSQTFEKTQTFSKWLIWANENQEEEINKLFTLQCG